MPPKITLTLDPEEAQLVTDALFFWDGWAGDHSINDAETKSLLAVRRRVLGQSR